MTDYNPQQPIHGSKKMYSKHKCRCETCRFYHAMRQRRKAVNIPGTPQNLQKREYLRNYRRKKQPPLEYDL